MTWRVVNISSRAKLELKMNYLVVRGENIKRIHIDEISVLVIENTGCALTVSLLEALWKKKVNIIFCDSRRNPGSQLLPFYSKFESNAQLYSQLKWDEETKCIVWSEIVRLKIQKQAENMKKINEPISEKILTYCKEIQKGDRTNREGHAAKVYFNALFFPEFSRSDEGFENAALNYGYSIILSCINRQIVACGYSTQIGIFHKNTFNQFNLGCDLMEPFRPLVDNLVTKLPHEDELSTETKHQILDILNLNVQIDGQKTTVLNAIQIYVKSVLDALDEKDISLIKTYNYEF